MTKIRKIHLALLGSDSLRGKEIKSVLERKPFPLETMDFFDPDVEDAYSKLTQFKHEPKVIRALNETMLSSADLLFLASEKGINKKYGKWAARQNSVAIDLQESFKDDRTVPVVVAGVNADKALRSKPRLIANPSPVAVLLSHLFHAIQSVCHISQAVASVLQPVSEYGEEGIKELANQSVDMLSSSPLTKKVFKAQIAFNLLSQTSSVDKQGFSSQERQILRETREILDEARFPLSLSLLQVPVFHAYSLMLYLELGKNMTLTKLEEGLRSSPYIKFAPPSQTGPVSVVSASGKEKIHVGQLKQDKARAHIFWLWAAADNLTIGSSLNAYEVARQVASEYFPMK
jgi:aspartate-semialdehyde dehydrogenase